MLKKYVFLVLTMLSAMAMGQGTTPNMGLSLPARGTLNWDVQMRANFSTIDLFYGFLENAYQGAWSNSTTYQKGQQVSASGSLYASLTGNNLNNPPASSPLSWVLMVSTSVGSVTSVALTSPPEFTVSGSPITGAGTLTLSKTAQTAGTFWGGPCTGIPATSGFRALCPTDIPNITESQVTGLTSDLAAKAPLASPALTGAPTAPTVSTGDNSTVIATSAFVKNQGYVTAATAPVTTVAGRTGGIVLAEGDINLTDITTNNASITKHGFLKKLPNNAALFLDGTGNFSAPTTGASVQGTLNKLQKGGGAGIAVDSSVSDDLSVVSTPLPFQAPTFQFPLASTISENGAGSVVVSPSGGNVFFGSIRFNTSQGKASSWEGNQLPSNTPGLIPVFGTPIAIQGQNGALTATDLFSNVPVGFYEVKVYVVVTTGSVGTLSINVIYTDETGAQSTVSPSIIPSTGVHLSFSTNVRSQAGTSIQVSTTTGAPVYSIYAVAIQLMNQ